MKRTLSLLLAGTLATSLSVPALAVTGDTLDESKYYIQCGTWTEEDQMRSSGIVLNDTFEESDFCIPLVERHRNIARTVTCLHQPYGLHTEIIGIRTIDCKAARPEGSLRCMFHFDDIVQSIHRNHYGRQFMIPVLTTAQHVQPDVDLTICLANHMTKIVKAGRKRELVRSFLSAHPI